MRLLDRAVEGLCIALLALISADLLAGIFSRYVLERTFVWYDEVARACFMWLVFLGAAGRCAAARTSGCTCSSSFCRRR